MMDSIGMKRLSASDNELLRAWRRGTLEPGMARKLEERMFFEPELAEAAHCDLDFAEGLSQQPQPKIRRNPGTLRRIWPLLAAASAGALAVLPFRLPQFSSPAPMALPNVEWVRIDYTRGDSRADDAVHVDPSMGTGALVLEFPTRIDAGEQRARIYADGRDAPIVDMTGLFAVNGMLTAVIPKARLKPGRYQIVVSAAAQSSNESDAGQALTFEIRPNRG